MALRVTHILVEAIITTFHLVKINENVSYLCVVFYATLFFLIEGKIIAYIDLEAGDNLLHNFISLKTPMY